MSRLDHLAESHIQSRVSALRTAVNELKGTQFAGSADLITERVASGNDFDFTATVIYQTTTAYEVTINARDTTLGHNPFVWQVFWDVVNTPPSMGFIERIDSDRPAGGQQRYRLYLWGSDAPHDPETLNIRVVIYGINIGTFSVVQII